MSRWHLLTQDFPPGFVGGISTWAEDLARALTTHGETVTVHARRTDATDAFDAALPFEVRRMRGRSWRRWQGAWARVSLARCLEPGDRVIAATWRLATRSLSLIQRRNAQLAIAFHGSDLTRLLEAPAPLHQVIGAANALLPVSGFLAKELVRLGLTNHQDPRVQVLPIPLPEVQERETPGRGLICVARPSPLKGLDRAVALAKALDMPLTLVGPADAVEGVQSLGVLPRAETAALVRGAAAAVLLPRTEPDGSGAEGLGIALLEAAAMGVPVIGCATGGVSEAVGPGLILDRPDDPDVASVRAFLADPEAGARGRAFVQANHGGAAAVATLQASLQ